MKGPLDRTKVVLRHLPHTISQSALTEQIDARFSGRYNWFCFRSGKNSLKSQSYSRAYIDFKQPEDVIEFAEFFDGHIFVNEKGTQFRTIVEYAPSQRVPKQCSKKDGREGTIGKDPEHLEFLESIAKPVENLPSAEIQLERKEAERAGAPKEAPIVTPLMDFVRQKRAAKSGPRRSFPNGKLMRRASGAPPSGSSSTAVRRGSEKRRTSTTTYVLRDTGKSINGKEKSAYVQVPKRDNCQLSEKAIGTSAASGSMPLEEEGAFGTSDIGNKKILLLKGKEKEIAHVTTGLSLQQSSSASVKHAYGFRQNQRREASGRIIRSILLNKDARQNQSSAVQSEHQNQDNDSRSFSKDSKSDDKVVGHDLHDFYSEKRTKNKDRPDRGVWTPFRRADGSCASDESLSSSHLLPDSAEGTHAETKYDLSNARGGEFKPIGSGRGGHFLADNGTHKHSGRRGPSHNAKDADGFSNLSEGKPSKKGVSAGYEKQVWVQKSSSGT